MYIISEYAYARFIYMHIYYRAGLACTLTGSGISRVGAAELIHEVGDDSMKMKTVVETFSGEINEVVCGYWHVISVLHRIACIDIDITIMYRVICKSIMRLQYEKD